MFRQWESDRSLALLPLIYDLLNEPPPTYTNACVHVCVFLSQAAPTTYCTVLSNIIEKWGDFM